MTAKHNPEAIAEIRIDGMPGFYLRAAAISDELRDKIQERFGDSTVPDFRRHCTRAMQIIILALAGELVGYTDKEHG